MHEASGSAQVPDDLYRSYLGALLANDGTKCRTDFEAWLERAPDLRSTYEDLVARSLYEVGDLWEQGKISVATEHAATAISESLLNLVYPQLFAHPRKARSAVVACSCNEHHQIGGKMVADFFELHGWRSHFLGANVSAREVMDVIAEKRPLVVALSVATNLGLDALRGMMTEIRAAYPDLPMLVGGQALRGVDRDLIERLPGVRCLASLAELETWIDEQDRRA